MPDRWSVAVCLAGTVLLTGCTGLVAETTVPLIGAGDRLPPMVVKREVPSGTGDMVFIHEEALRGGVRYVLSTPSGRIGSVAVQTVHDVPLERLRVEEGEARALYLAQLRITRDQVTRIWPDARRLAALSPEAGSAEMYGYGFVALVRAGTDAPRLALVECQSKPGADDHRLALSPEAAGLAFLDGEGRPAGDGVLQVKDRPAVRGLLVRYIQNRIAAGHCHADRPLELGRD